MNTEMLDRRFAVIGARVKVSGDGRGAAKAAPRPERVCEAIARSRGRHRVAMGTEQAARALGHVGLLD